MGTPARHLAGKTGIFGSFTIFILLLLVGPAAALAAAQSGGNSEGEAQERGSSNILSIVAQNATQTVNQTTQMKSATYWFQVKNTGDTGLPECNLQLTPWNFPPDKWSYNFIPSCPFAVTPGETKTVFLVIYPAPDADAKRWTFTLKGTTGTSSNQISINLDIKQYGGVDVLAPPAKVAMPGDTLEFDFEIVNTGNGKDKFFITSVETGVPTMVPYLKDQSNWTMDLNAQKSAIKTVVVTVPNNLKTSEGSAGYELKMTARSTFCWTVENTNWTFIRVLHVYNVSIGISPAGATLEPGEGAEFTVTVLNLGNGFDNISLSLIAAFDFSTWTVSLGRNWFNISAGRQNITRLKLAPPLNISGGTYAFELAARSSGPPPPQAPIERTALVNIWIRGIPPPRVGWEFSCEEPTELQVAAHSATVHTLTMAISNKGNIGEGIRLTLGGDCLSWTEFGTRDIFLGRNETRKVYLTVTVPSDAAIDRIYHLTMTAASLYHAGLIKQVNFSLEVVWIDIELIGFSEKSIPRRSEVGTQASISANIRNLGTRTLRDIPVGFFGPGAMIIKKVDIPSLGPGNGTSVNITWDGFAEGLNEIMIVADPDNLLQESDEDNNIHIESLTGLLSDIVIDSTPIFLMAGKARGTVIEGETPTVRVIVKNRGDYSKDLIGVLVQLTDNTTGETKNQTVSVASDSEAVVMFTLTARNPGIHNITVVVNPGSAIREKSPDNNEMSAALKVEKRTHGAGPDIGMMARPSIALLVITAVILVIASRMRKKTPTDRWRN